MKIKSIAAVGAMGIGLGIASFVGGTGTANAFCGEPTTPPLERANCLVSQDLAAFADSTDPFKAANTFLNGTDSQECDASGCVTVNDGLGVLDQPQTFADSLKDFAAGPVSSAG